MLEGVYDRTQRITTLNSIATETNGLRMRAGKEDVNFLEFGDEKGGYAANEYTPRTDSKTASLWLSTEHGAIGHTLIREEYDDAGKLKTSTCSK